MYFREKKLSTPVQPGNMFPAWLAYASPTLQYDVYIDMKETGGLSIT